MLDTTGSIDGVISACPSTGAKGTAWMTGSSRLYGPPAAVRVVSAFARFDEARLTRVRSTERPEPLMRSAVRKSMVSAPCFCGLGLDGVAQDGQLLARGPRAGAVL